MAPLDQAASGCLTFANSLPGNEANRLEGLDRVFVLISTDDETRPNCAWARVRDPRFAFAYLLSRLFPESREAGVSPLANVHAEAEVHETAYIGPYCTLQSGVVVGEGTSIPGPATIRANVHIGRDCLLKSYVSIGEPGFGIAKDENGNNFRIPHLGAVIIGDNVEVGSFTTVCSGTLVPTLIDDYVKLDDHVYVAHNVSIGSNSIVVAGTAICGSVTVGKNVWIGPNSSIKDGSKIGDRAFVGVGTVVIRDVDPDTVVAGVPARVLRERRE
ncbi:MAG: transferase [Gammaproteobacteria bacterium]|nr:transferase [Gammaproteobacteria bacterium]NIN37260.1 transferase [Gammaproteobacteria bacterium]NIO26118.1 transferase [Gammaproteobacteria bacterium]NIO66731.1 transferase [Gammaproteobacteria bacterium]NIP47531.1 transferase [Gammaproteobacteria bacterium]